MSVLVATGFEDDDWSKEEIEKALEGYFLHLRKYLILLGMLP